jgi:hypothetical protein
MCSLVVECSPNAWGQSQYLCGLLLVSPLVAFGVALVVVGLGEEPGAMLACTWRLPIMEFGVSLEVTRFGAITCTCMVCPPYVPIAAP